MEKTKMIKSLVLTLAVLGSVVCATNAVAEEATAPVVEEEAAPAAPEEAPKN